MKSNEYLIRLFRKVKAVVIGRKLRSLRERLGSVGPNSQLSADLSVDHADRVHIGNWVYIGFQGHLYGRGGLTIHDHTIIAPQVVIMTSMHNYQGARYVPYDEVELLKPVIIGVASWVGLGAIIMPGTILGNGCIVGAGAVVTKSFPDGSIVAGNPAKIIGVRDMDKFLKCLANEYTYLKQKAIDRLEKIERTSRGAIDLAK